MEIHLLTFGYIAEKIRGGDYTIETGTDTDQLILQLKEKFPELGSMTFRVAVNTNLITENRVLNHQDTIALLPPFSGG